MEDRSPEVSSAVYRCSGEIHHQSTSSGLVLSLCPFEMDDIGNDGDQIGSNSDFQISKGLRTIQICNYINILGTTPKKIVQNLLDSPDSEVVKRRQFWGTSTGWNSTEQIMLRIKALVVEGQGDTGVERWNTFILKEVSEWTCHLKIFQFKHMLHII